MSSREDGMRRAEEHADPEWMTKAREVVEIVCHRFPEFTSDDVWDVLDERYPEARTHENRVMGPLLVSAVSAGLCVIKTCAHCGTSKVVKQGRRKSAHQTDVAVYQSLVYEDRRRVVRTPRPHVITSRNPERPPPPPPLPSKPPTDREDKIVARRYKLPTTASGTGHTREQRAAAIARTLDKRKAQ